MKIASLLSFVLCGGLAGCGVKGKPLPPLEPVPIGDGSLSYQKKETRKKTAPKTP